MSSPFENIDPDNDDELIGIANSIRSSRESGQLNAELLIAIEEFAEASDKKSREAARKTIVDRQKKLRALHA